MGTRLLTELRSETARADSKASLLLGAMSMTVSLLVGLLAVREGSALRLSAAGNVLLWAATAALAGALVCLLLAVMPRYGTARWTPGRPLTYFGDIHRATEGGRLAEALAVTEARQSDGVLEALAQNSRIVGAKHRWIRAGLAVYSTGALLMPLAWLVG
ncbi:Pycsar system effector family protein [Streptomyces sulphureus]|uniref:Pycsar system effector family protein n=1 Tax=Streptomyces sulphureus TaxID=47758 RepID=UPI00037D6E6C|nr:Pycsar system effector family protein [Streptomyces sulphureus]